VLSFLFATLMSSPSSANVPPQPTLQVRPFGLLSSGQTANLYLLTNAAGMQVALTNYGATVVSLKVPDRCNNSADVVLGYDTPKEYETDKSYFGGTIGRYANRIAQGKFSIGGHHFTLAKNHANNSLHGGLRGFNKRMWTTNEIPNKLAVEFTYVSPDGEENFPGTLTTKARFTLPHDKNELEIDYTAITDQPTIATLTNHSYFNLSGEGSADILSHVLQLHAASFTPVDSTLIPTGEIRSVQNTPFDFTQPHPIGSRIHQPDEQLQFAKGYDHNWVLNKTDAAAHATPQLAAIASDPHSGRVLEVLTTEPGVQFYTGNSLDDTICGKAGKRYPFRSAFCLETQHFPDSPNHPDFPSTLVSPNNPLHSKTIFRFSAK
jgi:aldose 1-epimerase